MFTRRGFGLAAAGLSLASLGASPGRAAPKDEATVRGVKLGAITGAYAALEDTPAGQKPIDWVIARTVAAGAGYVELVNNVVEPPFGGACATRRENGRLIRPCGVAGQIPNPVPPGFVEERAKLREWRLNAPMDYFRDIRRRFDAAGVALYSYVMTIGDDFTDAEIDAVFKHMQALGVDKFCTNQMHVSMGPRTAPFAERYKIHPAFHNHANVTDPNEIGSPASLEKVLAMSPAFMINLDIGHFLRGGNDPFAFLKKHPTRITHLHIRDQKKDGSAADVGAGDVGVAEIIRYVRDNRLPIGLIVEQAGRSTTTDRAEAARQNIDWMRQTLQS